MHFRKWRRMVAVMALAGLFSAIPVTAAPVQAEDYRVVIEPVYNRATVWDGGVLLGSNVPQAEHVYDGEELILLNADGQVRHVDGSMGEFSPAASPNTSGEAHEYFSSTALLRVSNAKGQEGLLNAEGRLIGDGYFDVVKSGANAFEGILLQRGEQQSLYQTDGTLLKQYPASLVLTCRRESGYTIVYEGEDTVQKTPLDVFDPAGRERPELKACTYFAGRPDDLLLLGNRGQAGILDRDGNWLVPMDAENIGEITVDGRMYYLVKYADDTFSIYREDGQATAVREKGVLYPQINWPTEYLLLSVGDRFGVYHPVRGLLFEPVYEAVEVPSDRYIIALKDGRRQLFDRSGRAVMTLGEKWFDTMCDGQVGYMREPGRSIYIDMQTGKPLEVSEDAKVTFLETRRHGWITTRYMYADRKWASGLLDASGRVLLDAVYDTIMLPEKAEQPVVIAREGRYDLWKDGRILTADCAYTEITAFSGNVAIVKTASGVGLVDGEGREVAAPGTFRYLQFLQPRLLIGEDEKGYCLVDETGRVTARLPYQRIGSRRLGDSRPQRIEPLPGSGEGANPDVYHLLVWDADGKAGVIAVSAPLVAGDVNGDGVVNTTDARLALQAAVDKIVLTEGQGQIADVSGDGKVDTTDARLILQYAVEKIDHFPAGK